MVISVLSPHCEGNGNTITALFTALGLVQQKKKVLLSHTDAVSNSFNLYLGLEALDDKTSTPTQMLKLLREGAIQSSAISDYCRNVCSGLSLFTNNKSTFTQDDMLTLAEFLVTGSDFDYIVYDCNTTEGPVYDYIMENTDVVVLNVTQSKIETKRLEPMLKGLSKEYAGKTVVLVCNKYSAVAGTDKSVAKMLKLKTSPQLIHYNPWVINACNTGKMEQLYLTIKAKGSKVVELNSDISKLGLFIAKIRIKQIKDKQRLNTTRRGE